MIRTELCDMLGIKYPIIQAGMGPFGTNRLSVAAANAGVLGLVSSSGLAGSLIMGEKPYERFVSGIAESGDSSPVALKKIYRYVLEKTRDSKGVFGVNVMVSAELVGLAEEIIDTTIEVREEDTEMKKRLRAIVTSAGNPKPWASRIRSSDGLKWLHVVPSVKGAQKCLEAGVDGIIASGHEGGFHTAWEPLHTMVLVPAVVDACPGVPVIGAGGFCDGRTLVAALSLGAVGVQMGTRFLATQESDFVQTWKDNVVKAGDRGTLVARGMVGPARYLKTPAALGLAELTIRDDPELFIGKADDIFSEKVGDLIGKELEGWVAAYEGDDDRALTPGGECAQRIDDLPTVNELVGRIIGEAEETLAKLKSLAKPLRGLLKPENLERL
jgi:enoyl-[acyl-carrier protein] reductase II